MKSGHWLRWFNLPGCLRDLPSAILLVSVLLSFTTLLPIFCLWVCPRKIQLALFILSGTLALIVLPILSKKRIFCGLICPFGAWQAFWATTTV